MLQVGVHHRRIRRAGGENPLDAGTREAAPPDPPDATDAIVLPRQFAYHLPGAIGRIVVDEDDFPGNALQRRLELAEQRADVITLVEGGDDHRKLQQTRSLPW